MIRDTIGREITFTADTPREVSTIGKEIELSGCSDLEMKKVWVKDTKRVGGGYWKTSWVKKT